MTGLAQDVRYALRQLRKSPSFTTVTVLTLSLGIGANTAIFSVVNGVLLNPLPFHDASRIVSMFEATPNFPKGSISYPNFLDWRRDNRAFEAMAAYRSTDGSITGVGQPENVRAQGVSANFFPILGVNPILGRNFTAAEDRRGASPMALISEGLWKRKFGSDRNVIGKRLIVAGQPRTIIGVIPASFRLHVFNFRTADVYEAIEEETDPVFYLRDSYRGMDAIGLLKPGVTLAQARDDMKRVNAGLADAYPDVDGHIKANIIPLKDNIVGDMRPALLVLLGAVGFVLLIACVMSPICCLPGRLRGSENSRFALRWAPGRPGFCASCLPKAFCSRCWAAGLGDSREVGNRRGPCGSPGDCSACRGNRARFSGAAFHHLCFGTYRNHVWVAACHKDVAD
jgi:predicted permease